MAPAQDFFTLCLRLVAASPVVPTVLPRLFPPLITPGAARLPLLLGTRLVRSLPPFRLPAMRCLSSASRRQDIQADSVRR